MRFYYEVYFMLLLLVCRLEAAAKRHIVYWNSFMTPGLRWGSDFILNVKIGEFLDILCPQTSLISITNGPHEPEVFDLFNITKPDFEQCALKGKSNFIFACNRPERENKLTIKFQTISPSPLGFRFQYCKDYYFVALPRHQQNQAADAGCHENNFTRLHIKVTCKYKPTTTSPTTTTTTATTTSFKTTTTTSTTTLESPVSESPFDVEEGMEENVLHPKIIRPFLPPKKNTTTEEQLDGINEEQTGDKPHNAGPLYHCAPSLLGMMSLVALFLMQSVTSSIT